ncbi:MAG: hypothetical protein ACK5ML_13555 [Lachnospiraceae bacterium]
MNNVNEVEIDSDVNIIRDENKLLEITDGIVMDARADISNKNSRSIPIAELATLGAVVSALAPALRTVIQTSTSSTQELYQLANAGVGDVLKVAKNGNFWGAFKTVEGTSKFAQLQAADPLSVTSKTVVPIDPATMMMAVALFAIEKELKNIVEMEKQILSFLETEKESEIEADVQTLSNIIRKYKLNWDNEHFVASNHKMVLDIQRTARKHMNSYQKKVIEAMKSKQLIVAHSKVKSTMNDLQKKFQYYRLSLYTFSMASFIEIMLSGNFKEEYITGIMTEVEGFSIDYRNLYTQCSTFLENLIESSLETNALKRLGTASKAVGKLICSIPVIKEGSVDEFLQEGDIRLKNNAKGLETNVVESFAHISNPDTKVFIDKMKDMIQIYNHTSEIYFDEKKIYLVAS